MLILYALCFPASIIFSYKIFWGFLVIIDKPSLGINSVPTAETAETVK